MGTAAGARAIRKAFAPFIQKAQRKKTRKVREFNRCHKPSGPGGGQFAAKGQCALDLYPGAKHSLPVPSYLHAAVLAARRAGIEVYLTQQPEPVKDIAGNIMDPLALSHLQPGEVTFRDDKGHTYTMPRGRITLVLRGGEYEPTYTPDFWERPWEKKQKDLKPEDLKNPASRFDVISTLLHEIGHAVVRDPSRTDRAGEHVIHPAEIVAGERVTNPMAREVAAWQFAVAFMPKNLISAQRRFWPKRTNG